MRLLDSKTLQVKEVTDPGEHKYAILSHTWDSSGEVNFQQIEQLEMARRMTGFQKIEKTCSLAASHNIGLAWIDTCCIDKTSSAELSEAINSMFYWYKEAYVCYVYLSDLDPLPTTGISEAQRRTLLHKRLRHCRWFTRGWTLQELIAPSRMVFFDRHWNPIDSKDGLASMLSDITHVDQSILLNMTELSSIPTARKMSWAAGRNTTRIEDRAYSLLGIFDINMPLLYGEGPKAFLRLQHQIASQSNDLSLFAWQHQAVGGSEEPPEFRGILALSPDEFRHCANLKRHADQFHVAKEFSITNSGLRMEDTFRRIRGGGTDDELLLSLDCVGNSQRTENSDLWLGIRLIKIGNTYLRHWPSTIETATNRGVLAGNYAPTDGRFNQEKAGNSTKYILVQTYLTVRDTRRVSQLLNSRIVVKYGQKMKRHIGRCAGLPSECSSEGRLTEPCFRFNARGRDNFLGIHLFTLPGNPFSPQLFPQEALPPVFSPLSPKLQEGEQDPSVMDPYGLEAEDYFALVCSLQWVNGSYQVRVALFSAADTIWNMSAFSEEQILMDIKDKMLVRYSDTSGVLDQSRMPTQVPLAIG